MFHLDNTRNEDIRKELNIIPILVKIRNRRTQWERTLGMNGQQSHSKSNYAVPFQREEEGCKTDGLRPEEAYSLQL